jgi:hypothetical protein
MERWIHIDGAVFTAVSREDFEQTLLEFFTANNWMFAGVTSEEEDIHGITNENENTGGELI